MEAKDKLDRSVSLQRRWSSPNGTELLRHRRSVRWSMQHYCRLRWVNAMLLAAWPCFAPVCMAQDSSFINSSAVDTSGVSHSSTDYPRGRVPWMRDQIRTFAPEYPSSARFHRREGEGLFRVALDPRSGAVAKVTVVRSTGYKPLDDSAVAALYRGRWTPGKWKEINIPVKFTLELGSGSEHASNPFVHLPPSGGHATSGRP